jgi:ABC-2 type transport system ATP-binding protein
MQLRLRRFLFDYNRQSGVTMILTSHYMADVMALCPRVILIHHGRVLYDGELNSLAQKLAPFKLVRVGLSQASDFSKTSDVFTIPTGIEVIERAADRLTLRIPRAEAPNFTAQLLHMLPVADLTVEDPPIEAVIDQIYTEAEL